MLKNAARLLPCAGLVLFFAADLSVSAQNAAVVGEMPAQANVASPGQTPARARPVTKDLPSPPNALSLYLNGMLLPGWQPQPFYMWTLLSAPVEKEAAAVSADTNASSADLPQAVNSVYPKLPDGDAAKEAILAEYRLNGFFRKSFKRGQRSIYIDVYDFQNADGAYGAYNYLRRGSTTVLPRGDAASEDDQSISLVQGKTFLSIYGTSQDDDESKEVLTKVANEAVKYLGDKGLQPAILGRLPRLELLHGSEKIVMGPNSIRRFFPAPFLNSLVLDPGRVVGCVADYQIQEPAKERLKLLVLSFRSQVDAATNYQKFLEAIGVAHDDNVSTMVNQPINVIKSGHTYIAIEQRGADLLMITGARKRFSPALVLRQVR